MDKKIAEEMIELAIKQLDFSYVPYSGFKVGAALRTKDGIYYTGCNIENASYTPTNCAERTAFFKAVSEGVREFEAICVVGGKDGILTDYASGSTPKIARIFPTVSSEVSESTFCSLSLMESKQ